MVHSAVPADGRDPLLLHANAMDDSTHPNRDDRDQSQGEP